MPAQAHAQLDWLKKEVNNLTQSSSEDIKKTSLSETQIGKGLKEALRVGINQAVDKVSQDGGYSDNPQIRIPMPENLRLMEAALRKVGMGKAVDDFVVSMNQAAESAAPAARDIFLDALFDMNFEDVNAIYRGGNTAATDYFKAKTSDQLKAAFQKPIDQALAQYDITDQFNALMVKYNTLPFAGRAKMLSPDEYVINKSLDGLFYVLGQQEAQIRENPSARVTDLLKTVFQKE